MNYSDNPATATLEAAEFVLDVGPANSRGTRTVSVSVRGVQHHDQFNANSADKRGTFIRTLAKKLGVPKEQLAALDDLLVEAAAAADAAAQAQAAAAAAQPAAKPDPLASCSPAAVAEAERLLANPDMLAEIVHDFGILGIVGELLLALTLYLVGTSRKMRKPLNACVQASPASGKSFVAAKVVGLFPKSDVISATDMTPQSLYYLPPGSLENKLVFVAERKHMNSHKPEDAANSTLAFREMTSSGELHKLLPMKDGNGGMTTVCILQKGPIAYVETTTQESILDEDSSRMLLLTTDESVEQTASILESQAREAACECVGDDMKAAIIAKHCAAQLMLKSYDVQIPYAQRLPMPAVRVISRRAFPQFLGLIAASTVLNQNQRDVSGGRLVATLDDYRVAYELFAPVLRRLFAPLPDRTQKFLETIEQKIAEQARSSSVQLHAGGTQRGSFTQKQAEEWSGLSATPTWQRLRALVDAGRLLRTDCGRGNTNRYTLLASRHEGEEGLGLISPDALAESIAAELQPAMPVAPAHDTPVMAAGGAA